MKQGKIKLNNDLFIIFNIHLKHTVVLNIYNNKMWVTIYCILPQIIYVYTHTHYIYVIYIIHIIYNIYCNM